MYLKGDSLYAVYPNSIFMIKYHDTKYFEINCGKTLQIFFVCTQVSLTIITSMLKEAYSSLQLTKGKYSMAYENVITPVILFL
jgi:hypothetical protein